MDDSITVLVTPQKGLMLLDNAQLFITLLTYFVTKLSYIPNCPKFFYSLMRQGESNLTYVHT